MKSFDRDIATYTEKTRLRAAEKQELRERLLSYMEYHPLPKDMRNVQEVMSGTSFTAIRALYARAAAGAFAFLFMIMGVPYIAEQAVPGDVLYPVKTHLNESIRAQFVSSAYEKVQFETELMERRIAEARVLAEEGKLTAEAEAKIAKTVKGHADAAQEGIASIKENDADGAAIAAITFGSALDVQAAVFENRKGTSTSDAVGDIASAVRAAKQTTDAQRGTTTPSYARLAAQIEQSTTRAYELFESVKVSATDGEEQKVERRFADIERKVRAAQQAHDRGDTGEDVQMLTTALTDIQKLLSFMTDIDVRQGVELDVLVPVVLTPEERVEHMSAELETVQKLWEHYGFAAADTDATSTAAGRSDAAEALKERLEYVLTETPTHIAIATSALETGDLTTAHDALDVMDALFAEIDGLVAAVEEALQAEREAAGSTASSTDANRTNS